jgi:non-specific serine/threonine protein kinase
VARHLGTLATTLARWDEAQIHFARALALDEGLGARPCIARGKYELGRMLVARGAAVDVPAIGPLLDDAAALATTLGMAGLGAAIARLQAAPAPADRNAIRKDGRVWIVTFLGTTVRVKDGKGLRYLALLLAQPEREWHALDLTAALGGGPAESRPLGARQLADVELAVRGLGVAGVVLDARGKAQYRERRDTLRVELAEAEADADVGRVERVRSELEALDRALASAYGLGGRSVRAVSAVERARVAATKAIRQTIAAIVPVHPRLAAHLDRAIKTGRFLAYRPETAVDWRVD